MFVLMLSSSPLVTKTSSFLPDGLEPYKGSRNVQDTGRGFDQFTAKEINMMETFI